MNPPAVVSVPTRAGAGHSLGSVVALAAVLGALAIAVDNVPILQAPGALLAVSTGLSWAGAAVLMGARRRSPWQAAEAGVTVLLGAVATYYGGIALLGSRPGSSTADLLSAAITWGAAAAVTGPLAGWLGWVARNGSRTQRPVAWGAMGGMLLSQGVYLSSRWVLSPADDPLPGIFLPLLGGPMLVTLIGSWRSRPVVALAVMGGVSALGAVAWGVILSQV